MRKTRVLLAEDDTQLAFVIKDNLEEAGYEVVSCSNGEEALDQFARTNPDLCLLDVNMPQRDGFSLAKKIRQKSDVIPILFISARSLEDDKLKGFQTGADDFITKPFHIRELLMRMQVFIRRNKMLRPETPLEFRLGDLRYVPSELRLIGDKDQKILTQREAELLTFFCLNPNKVLKREDVLTSVWGKSDFFLGRSMDVFVTKLRKYLSSEKNITIETIHGIGYRFVTR
ncbi:MAG: response regulator transcription factor [Chitinophagaceae bacterium]|nr:response regulator transcription factor [Chitinophagaceae bacterium]MBN8668149.1 response regulator transcription factor [Chitinophagales bacterium]